MTGPCCREVERANDFCASEPNSEAHQPTFALAKELNTAQNCSFLNFLLRVRQRRSESDGQKTTANHGQEVYDDEEVAFQAELHNVSLKGCEDHYFSMTREC